MIHIGDTVEGEKISIPVFHCGCFGQSGVGKTKLLKYMISQVVEQGYRVLIFDSKIVGPEFEGIGREIPLYLHESTDPDVVRSLLENLSKPKLSLDRFRGGFIEICEGAQRLGDVDRNLDAKLADTKTIKGWTRDMYKQIRYDFSRLLDMLANYSFAKTVKVEGITRMATWRLPNVALQGLIVRSTIERIMQEEERVIVLIDEAPNFAPQKDYNPAKRMMETLNNQGRKDELFMWCSGQTLTGFDKASLKNIWYWVLGRQMESNEAKDVYNTLTQKKWKEDQIRTLKVREFLVSTPEFTEKVMVPMVDEAQLFPTQSYDGEILERIKAMADDIERRIQVIAK